MEFYVTVFLQRVDQIGGTYVQNAYQQLGQALTGGGVGGVNVAGLLLTLYVIFWGFGLWFGTQSGSPSQIAFRLFRAFAIYALATSWSDFQAFAYRFMNEAPSAIGNAMLGAVPSANNTGLGVNLTSVDGVQNALTNVWRSTLNLGNAFIGNAGYLSFGPYIFAGLMIACVALLIAYAVFLITLAKLFLWLLLALAPVFILLLLFGVTSRFFAGWLSALVQYATVQILVYAFLAFYLSLSQQFFDQATAVSGAQTATFGNVAPIIVVALIGFFLLMQITMVAATIAGGIAIRAPSLGRGLDGARGLLALPAQGWREARDGAQRRLGRLTLTERQIGERMGRQQLAARGWLQSPEARQIQAQLAGRGSGRP